MLVGPGGYALTNCHVADGHKRLTAITSDGDQLDAELIGDDPAIIAMAQGLGHAHFGRDSAWG